MSLMVFKSGHDAEKKASNAVDLWILLTFWFCWPRGTLKGPKRSFVVVALLLGVESSSKLFLGTKDVRGSKNFRGNKKCSYQSKLSSLSPNCNGSKVWLITILNFCVCLAWPYLALYVVASYGLGVAFHCYGQMCPPFDLVWPCVTKCGLVRPFMVVYGILWSFMA